MLSLLEFSFLSDVRSAIYYPKCATRQLPKVLPKGPEQIHINSRPTLERRPRCPTISEIESRYPVVPDRRTQDPVLINKADRTDFPGT